MDHVTQRRQVVAGAGGVGQCQQPMELGRHHVRVGDAVALDEPQALLRVPLVHQHHGVAQLHGGSREAHDGRVVERRAAEVHVVVPRL